MAGSIGDTVTDMNSTWIPICVTFSKTVNLSSFSYFMGTMRMIRVLTSKGSQEINEMVDTNA